MLESLDHLWVLTWALLLTAASWGAAYFLGFFTPLSERKPRIGAKEAVLAFALFLSFQLFILPLLITGIALLLGQTTLSLQAKAWLNIGSIAVLGSVLLALTFSLKSKVQWFSDENLFFNIKIGLGCWFLAFPLIVLITQFLTLIFSDWLGFDLQEQLAVKQVKSVQEFPVLFTVNLAAVFLLVPTIEELLFRGFLQESLLKKFTSARAILLTSLIFSLFHFSASQGINNILILSSLFVLSCLLGYLKERQRSLIPSIALHGIFNGISLVQIFLMQ